MAYDYDDQLIEAAAVRRERLTAGLLFGPDRLRRRWSSHLRVTLAGTCLAGLICAGCVGVSYVNASGLL
ncbi:MAG TPA: hypothetical protein VJ976_08375 [Ornithinimicrobium sp.]|uniref:hypothetical protein n=1 Tax=Ornithinimicrobium sp. TaxID=1977084 RepID=UPI002B499BE4|nr:hypothetical protein [Ornithinimicrobium sp.]HKJ12388.1 hypothetical protein [Ornithinimicrobium sp.]